MDLVSGLFVEEPAIVIPWGLQENELRALVGDSALNRVTRGYYTAKCVLLGGLRLNIGFHFRPRTAGYLREFELFREGGKPIKESYDEFQSHLEVALGPPTRTEPSDSGFSSHEWRQGDVSVVHFVFDRFGPEEHVRFRK